MLTTSGHLLGGRLRYEQPADGYRSGIEPVLLAAAVPARPGDRVLEGGTGAGAGLMCLAARVPGLVGVGVEIDPAMADLARRNIGANGFARLEIMTADLLQTPLDGFDHAFANPPWHDARSTPSPLGRRLLAKQAAAGTLERWIGALMQTLRPGGTLTLILPATLADQSSGKIVSLLPKSGRASKLALVLGAKTSVMPRGCGASTPAPQRGEVVLHEADGRYTPEIEAVLRHGAALPVWPTEGVDGPDGFPIKSGEGHEGI